MPDAARDVKSDDDDGAVATLVRRAIVADETLQLAAQRTGDGRVAVAARSLDDLDD